MSKMIEASCNATGVVSVDNLSVSSVTVLSQGHKDSNGALFLDGDKKIYITSNASDIKDLIASIVSILDKIILIATGLDAGAPSPGTQSTNISELTAMKTTLNSSKDLLK